MSNGKRKSFLILFEAASPRPTRQRVSTLAYPEISFSTIALPSPCRYKSDSHARMRTIRLSGLVLQRSLSNGGGRFLWCTTRDRRSVQLKNQPTPRQARGVGVRALFLIILLRAWSVESPRGLAPGRHQVAALVRLGSSGTRDMPCRRCRCQRPVGVRLVLFRRTAQTNVTVLG